MDDGTERACPHPGGFIAQELTGKTLTQLSALGRLSYRYQFLCLACGTRDFYGHRDRNGLLSDQGAAPKNLPPGDEAARHACRTCGARRLYPLRGEREEMGCLASLAFLLGLRRIREPAGIPCPRCGQGVLRSALVAIS